MNETKITVQLLNTDQAEAELMSALVMAVNDGILEEDDVKTWEDLIGCLDASMTEVWPTTTDLETLLMECDGDIAYVCEPVTWEKAKRRVRVTLERL